MPLWLQILFMALTAVGVFGAALFAALTYIRAGKTHELVNGTRTTANELVSKIAYMQGRQDTVVRLLEPKPEVQTHDVPGADS